MNNFEKFTLYAESKISVASSNTTIMEDIKWKYFFGSKYEHYYKSEINGFRVEKHEFRGGVKYSIGNMDLASTTYKTESELKEAVMKLCSDCMLPNGQNNGNCYRCTKCGRIVD